MVVNSSRIRPQSPDRIHLRDYVLLAAFALVLFGYGTISGKPLTMHEARLPQLSREMLATGRWLLPHSGERPWLERPPLPHWVTLAVGHVVGRLDRVWIVRIPPVLMGTLTLLMVGWTAARLFGREIGVLSALLLATMYEFYFYAGQAEDEVFLAALVALCVALFVGTEFPARAAATVEEPPGPPAARFLGNRPWTVWAFFGALGITSLAKGPLVGATEVGAAIGAFLLLSRARRRILRYVWLWGWLLFAVATLAWPVAAYRAYPSVWDNWKYDYAGPFGKEPFWYYAVTLLWTAAPWTPAALVGLWVTWKDARRAATRPGAGPPSPHLFLWCWAVAPLVVLSVPARKHHHYLVPALAGWGVLAAFGIRHIWRWVLRGAAKPPTLARGMALAGLPGLVALGAGVAYHKIPGPVWLTAALGAVWLAAVAGVCVGLSRQSGRLALGAMLAGMMIFSFWGQSVLATANNRSSGDLAFLAEVRKRVPATEPLMIVAHGSLDFFRHQFYSRPEAVLLHNVTYLRDERIRAAEVYVIARYRERRFLAKELGTYEVVTQSPKSRREESPDDRWTLFRLQFNPDLVRYRCPDVSVLQAMDRGEGDQAGPYCGPAPAADARPPGAGSEG
jgi:4-amino-4-deoxy-L-arabinose transferase-like glycosyltransferase